MISRRKINRFILYRVAECYSGAKTNRTTCKHLTCTCTSMLQFKAKMSKIYATIYSKTNRYRQFGGRTDFKLFGTV